jgi:hypothetical protein
MIYCIIQRWTVLKKFAPLFPQAYLSSSMMVLLPLIALNTERVLGSLQYLSLTRPGISFAVNKLSQFMQKPTQTHWTTTKRLLHYLKQIIFHGLKLTCWPFLMLTVVGNLDDRTATSVYITFVGSNPISWSSKRRCATTRSSTEAEYRAPATAASETMRIPSFLQ